MSPDLLWPPERAGEALLELVRAAGLPCGQGLLEGAPAELDALQEWLPEAAASLGLRARAVQVDYGDSAAFVASGGPALLELREQGLICLLGGARRGRVRVLGRDGRVRRVPVDTLRKTLCSVVVARHGPPVERLVAQAGLEGAAAERVVDALVTRRLGGRPIRVGWLVELPPDAAVLPQLKQRGLPGQLGALLLAHGTQYLLLLVAWWLVGRAALQGELELSWVLGWALLLLTLVPLRMASTWLQGSLTLRAGAWLKARLLEGALRLDPEEVREEGSGALLGRVMESEALEALSLGGGIAGGLALLELGMAAVILGLGAGGLLSVLALVLWLALTSALALRHGRRYRAWTAERVAMTEDLVSQMAGHQTRIVQEAPELWHEEEDQRLSRTLDSAAALDADASRLEALVPRGWLLVGVASLGPALVGQGAATPALAVSIGGLLLALQALQGLVSGLVALSGAAVAWEQTRPLFDAAARPQRHAAEAALEDPGAALLLARDVGFRYAPGARSILQGVDLRLAEGDRVLLEGPSGSGKSTLATLLSGLREPSEGLLLLRGLDARTLGARGWRRRVVSSPQYHENHVLTETLAFNLLMGRRWPPEPGDVEDALALCDALGLGPLLERMPSGILQIVGESGWRLSHGERSRIFLARALLQDPALVVLDESFAALDPENLERSLRTVMERSRALLVIAHP